MPDYQFQIKGRLSPKESRDAWGGRWSWPPLYTEMITANTKPEARKMVDDLVGRGQLPMKVKKDSDAQFLVSITEIKTDRDRAIFETRSCKQCGASFRVVDKYNDLHEIDSGRNYCSNDCKQKARKVERYTQAFFEGTSPGKHPAVIYKITNKLTKMAYIGQTSQAFTLRWYQHFFQSDNSGSTFHKAIAESSVEDWTFEVLEVVDMAWVEKCNHEVTEKDILDHVRAIESDYIREYDTVNHGYNTMS